MKKILTFLLVAVALFGIHSTLYADAIPLPSSYPALYFDDGGDKIGYFFVVDNGAGDLNSDPGVILYSGKIGNWIVNTTTGLTYGSTTPNLLDLNSVNATSSAGGTLVIALLQTGYIGNNAFILSAGGTTQGEVTIEAMADGTIFAPVTYVGPSFSANRFGYVPNSDSFDAEILVKIVHVGAATTSFDVNLSRVPEPTTMLLLGFGLLGLAGLRKRD